jgi:hypothetical protein
LTAKSKSIKTGQGTGHALPGKAEAAEADLTCGSVMSQIDDGIWPGMVIKHHVLLVASCNLWQRKKQDMHTCLENFE